jgi:hypothetical protein
MTSHELANLLLTLPDLTIGLSCSGSNYSSEGHKKSHGTLMVAKGKLGTREDHIIIGCMLDYLRPVQVEEVLYTGSEEG